MSESPVRLLREVRRHSERVRIRLSGVVAGIVVTVVVFPHLTPGPRCRDMSKGGFARTTLRAYVHEAYPQWRLRNPTQPCPGELSALHPYMDTKGPRDPWGEHYQMLCVDHAGIAVFSRGEDGRPGTADDLWATP